MVYATAVNMLASLGVVNDIDNHQFAPERQITLSLIHICFNGIYGLVNRCTGPVLLVNTDGGQSVRRLS